MENQSECTVAELYSFLKNFMITEYWNDVNVSEQARGIFTTICLIGKFEADTYLVDEMLRKTYIKADMEEIMEYEDYIQFMLKYIVQEEII